jgi:hypothetical protein
LRRPGSAGAAIGTLDARPDHASCPFDLLARQFARVVGAW